MGDGNAVCFMTVAHANLLRAHGAYADESMVNYARTMPEPSDLVFQGIVVDDFNVVALVPESLARGDPGADTEIMRRADAAYAADGICPVPEKCFDHDEIFTIWGATMHGGDGTTRAGVETTCRAALLTLRMLWRQRATAGAWTAVIGLWTYVMMYCRDAFSLLWQVYHEARDLRPGEVFRPSGTAQVELEVVLAFLPLLFTDNRAQVSTQLFATDASSHSAAVVRTVVDPRAARELWRHRAQRRGGARLQTLVDQLLQECGPAEAAERARSLLGYMREERGGASEADDADESQPPPNWSAGLADSLGWRLSFRYRFKRACHINTKEGLVIASLIRHLALDPSRHRMKFMNLEDSSVNVCAWAKGRSRKAELNSVLRSVVPERLLCRVSLGGAHVRSAANPADDETRGRRTRSAPLFAPASDSELGRLLAGSWDSWEELLPLFVPSGAWSVPDVLVPCAPGASQP